MGTVWIPCMETGIEEEFQETTTEDNERFEIPQQEEGEAGEALASSVRVFFRVHRFSLH